jgi:hypothetical protein
MTRRNVEKGKLTFADGGVYEGIWNSLRCLLKGRRLSWKRGDDVAHGGAYEGKLERCLVAHGEDEYTPAV